MLHYKLILVTVKLQSYRTFRLEMPYYIYILTGNVKVKGEGKVSTCLTEYHDKETNFILN
jgi:hypothetical protein